MTKISAANLLDQLNSKNLANSEQLAGFVIGLQQQKELPLYLRILVAAGAFIASACFLTFLWVIDIFNFEHETQLIIWGLLFIIGGIGLQQVAGHSNSLKHSFFMQFSFALMVIGNLLCIYGVYSLYGYGWSIPFVLLIITSTTYHIYRMSIYRFLSSFATLRSIVINILDQDSDALRELLLNGFFLLQFVAAIVLLTHNRMKRDYLPLSYALVFSLCAYVLSLASFREPYNLIFINMILTGGLIALFCWAAGGKEKLKTKPLILASIGAVILGSISAPGILLTIGLMTLGYAKHDKTLIILGILLIPLFLFLYYYNLDVSLLQKSIILIGSGVVLLAGRLYLRNKGWDARISA